METMNGLHVTLHVLCEGLAFCLESEVEGNVRLTK